MRQEMPTFPLVNTENNGLFKLLKEARIKINAIPKCAAWFRHMQTYILRCLARENIYLMVKTMLSVCILQCVQ